MGCILTCCIESTCGCCRGEEETCYGSDTYEAVAAATSESTTVEPGKLDVGATEGHDLQHISNQKMLTGPPEDSLNLKSLPPSEEDNHDAQILPSPVQGSEDNLSLLSLPRSEDYDGDHDDDDDDAQISPSSVLGSSEDNLSLVSLPRSEINDWDDDDDNDDDDFRILPLPDQARPEHDLFLSCSPQYKDEDDDDDDVDCDVDCDDDDDDVQITAWKENDLMLESLSEEEIHPVCPEDGLFLRGSPQRKDEEQKDDDDDDDDDDVDVQITAWKDSDLMLESLSDEETYPVCPEDGLFLRGSPQRKDEEEEKEEDDDDDVQITAWNENDLTLESISDEETHPVCPEDGLFLRGSPQRKDEEEEKEDDDDNNDVQITAWNENDLTLESISDEETYPVCPEDGLFLRGSPQRKDEEEEKEDDDDNNDVQITAWNENDLTLESISDEETYPG
ncbi:aspartate-rich protein 1 isoform X2 [Macaca nemestrina]|uniref:aspartate-rich protein 1 isoform X2 n=1 Tax=Macaca nemestrina TaxID=9545 RepID=UPI0039B84479